MGRDLSVFYVESFIRAGGLLGNRRLPNAQLSKVEW